MSEPKVVKIQTISKDDFEGMISAFITDEQWEKVADELEGRAENFLDGLLSDIIQDFKEGVGVFDGDL